MNEVAMSEVTGSSHSHTHAVAWHFWLAVGPPPLSWNFDTATILSFITANEYNLSTFHVKITFLSFQSRLLLHA